MPWFEARGYTVAAPDVPHHGDLDRRGLPVIAVLAAEPLVRPPLVRTKRT